MPKKGTLEGSLAMLHPCKVDTVTEDWLLEVRSQVFLPEILLSTCLWPTHSSGLCKSSPPSQNLPASVSHLVCIPKTSFTRARGSARPWPWADSN